MDPDDFKERKISNYIIKKEIGKGGFSRVYLAEELLQPSDISKDNNLSNDKIKELTTNSSDSSSESLQKIYVA